MGVQSKAKLEIQRFPVTAAPSAIYKAVAEDGVAVIERFLTPEQVAELNQDVDPRLIAMRKTETDGKTTNISLPPPGSVTSVWMADLVPNHVQRVHNLPDFSKVFRNDILNHGLMHGVSRLAFDASGDYWLGYGAVIENGPNTEVQPWHRDQPKNALINDGPGSPEGMLNFFTALTDFTEENGTTQYIWGSNKLKEQCEPDADHPVVFCQLKAGDTAVLSGKIVHRGSLNAAQEYRRALALMIIPGLLTPFDANWQLPLHLVETMTPLAQRMVGRRSLRIAPPKSVPYSISISCLNMKEAGEQMNLKSNQVDEEK